MNVFYLDHEPQKAAQLHCDQHVRKMIVEYAQMLSTAHRVLDGQEYYDLSRNGRRIKRWQHPESYMETGLYKASHVNHPSAVWVRESKENYNWLFECLMNLGTIYTGYTGKTHKTMHVVQKCLVAPPHNTLTWATHSIPPQCMPDEYKHADTVEAYKEFYRADKSRFATFKYTQTPDWMTS